MEIIIAEKIHKSLEMNSSATKFINEINQLDEDVFIINFEGVIFISLSFAQAYWAGKLKSSKDISEINLSEEVKPMMDLVEKRFMENI